MNTTQETLLGRFLRTTKAYASEFLEKLIEMFPQYYTHRDVLS